MKYTVCVEINKPLQEVLDVFLDPTQAQYWMEGLEEMKHESGTQGEVGSKSTLTFSMNNRTITMTETIVSKQLPEEMTFEYDDLSGKVYNIVRCEFEAIDEYKTEYRTVNTFEFKGFVMKTFGFLFPSMFKNQSKKYLQNFKNHVERPKNKLQSL